MTETIDASEIASLLQDAARGLSENHDRLSELDALSGDGDMGVTAELIAKAIDQSTASSEPDVGKLLLNCGTEINRRSPSTFGTLVASALSEAGKASLGRKEVGINELAHLGRSAIEGIRRRGKSNVGEKTMLDCIVPAVDALERALSAGVDPVAAIEASIDAANVGATNTTSMAATHGRAAYRQDRGVGIQDAGATAIFFMLEAAGKGLVKLETKRKQSDAGKP